MSEEAAEPIESDIVYEIDHIIERLTFIRCGVVSKDLTEYEGWRRVKEYLEMF